MLKDVAPSIITPVQKTLIPPAAAPARRPVAPAYSVRWMEVTAYCACKKCCGPRAQGITASGRPVSFNGGRFVAADRDLSFNTRLRIPGYADGQAVPVLDRGGAIKGDKLDVYFPTHAEARQWGRRFIPVTVLN
jgi:3D (Asp-Asp-Asp) domain-containing protein